jgi:anti-sigma regulatory factor (Ser/Thr protein kinase)
MARPAEDARSDRAWRTFAPNASEVFAARHFVACVLEEWGLEIEDLPLLVSELATNAVLHARSDFEVTVIRLPQCVRVEVFDQNTRLPSFAVAPTDAYSGRGLMLLRGLSTNWGVESHSDLGKTIWFEVAMPRSLKGSGRTIATAKGAKIRQHKRV